MSNEWCELCWTNLKVSCQFLLVTLTIRSPIVEIDKEKEGEDERMPSTISTMLLKGSTGFLFFFFAGFFAFEKSLASIELSDSRGNTDSISSGTSWGATVVLVEAAAAAAAWARSSSAFWKEQRETEGDKEYKNRKERKGQNKIKQKKERKEKTGEEERRKRKGNETNDKEARKQEETWAEPSLSSEYIWPCVYFRKWSIERNHRFGNSAFVWKQKWGWQTKEKEKNEE